MRKVTVAVAVAGLFLVASVVTGAPSHAQVPFPFPVAYQADLLFGPDCSAPLASVEIAGPGVEGSAPTATSATCTADCGSFPDVSCTVSGSCTAIDRNCSVMERGRVICNGQEYFCAQPCACQNGAVRYVDTGGCCKVTLKKESFQQCIDGQWVHQSFSCAPVPHCPEA